MSITFCNPTGMKYVEVTILYKKDDKNEKKKRNYDAISTLPNVSRVHERLVYNQLYPYFHTIFRKGFKITAF